MWIGVDLDRTKIAIGALSADGGLRLRERTATPRHDDGATIGATSIPVRQAERRLGSRSSVGVGIRGALFSATGLIGKASSTSLPDRPLDRDLPRAPGRPVPPTKNASCRAPAHVISIPGPDAVEPGGGLSNMTPPYENLPWRLPRHVFSDRMMAPTLKAQHGDSSGASGAARLRRPEELPAALAGAS